MTDGTKYMIETYEVKAQGYHPFLIRDGWQVAKLNFMPEQHIDAITNLDLHHETDEAFILLKGNAVLIAAEVINSQVNFEYKLLKQSKTYNIPKNMWHNIAMTEDCELIIIEKSNTHISDFEHFTLTKAQCKELHAGVKTLLETVR